MGQLPGEKGIPPIFERPLAKRFRREITGESPITDRLPKEGRRCRHNLIYWNNGEYLGLGAGAFSYTGGIRQGNIKDAREYIALTEAGKSAVAESEQLDEKKTRAETVMLKLRLSDGVSVEEMKTGLEEDAALELTEKIRKWAEIGLINKHGGHISLTEKGMLVSNEIFKEII